MTDRQLLQKMREKKPEAMKATMDRYGRYIYTVIANVLGYAGGHEDIEELRQDVFYGAWLHADSINGNLKAYLGAMARNKAKNWLRSNQKTPTDIDLIEIPDQGKSLEDEAVQKEMARLIHRAIHQMTPKDREIFLRHYYYLQTAEQIAIRMNLSRNTVLSRLSRGKKILSKALNKEEFL